MKIITLDNKSFNIKYLQSKENITFNIGTSSISYPDFVGSKLFHNSSGSNIYALTFAIHSSQQEALTRSLKVILTNPDNAIKNETYGALTDIILEHKIWGAIFGKIVTPVKIDTSSEADVIFTFAFQENTKEKNLIKKDLNDENTNAVNAIDAETTANFDIDISPQDKSVIKRFGDKLASIYENIQNNQVITAFNNFNTEINAAILDSQRVMNSVKDILALPNKISNNTADKILFLKAQAEAIKSTSINSYNIALFNANSFSYNMGITSQTAFVSESALAAAAGIRTVPLT